MDDGNRMGEPHREGGASRQGHLRPEIDEKDFKDGKDGQIAQTPQQSSGLGSGQS